MNVWVVIPVGPNYDDEHLIRCVNSVQSQSHIRTWPLLVLDGAKNLPRFDAKRLPLPNSANDIGSTPRAIGSIYAFGQGADAVCWLDSDNWLRPDHVDKLIEHHNETGKPVVCSGRAITDTTGQKQAPCLEMVPGSGFYDTSTFMVTKTARPFAHIWAAIDKSQHWIGDKVVSKVAEDDGMISCHYEPTVYYRSTWKFHYVQNNWPMDGLKLKSLAELAPK